MAAIVNERMKNMSDNGGKFQKNSRSFGGGGKGRGRPPGGGGGGGFGKRFEGDRGAPRSGGSDRPYKKREFGDRPSGGDRPYKKREFGDRPAGGDRPYKKREFGDRPSGGDRPYKKREFGDRPSGDRPYRPAGDRPYKPAGDRPYQKREFGDRPRSDRPSGDRPFQKREFGDRPRGDRPSGDRPFQKREFGDRPRGDRPFEKREGGDRPFKKREFGDRDAAPRGGSDRPFKKREGEREERPRPSRFDTQKTYRRDPSEGKKPAFRPRANATFDDAGTDVAEFEMREKSADTRNRLKSERASFGAPSSAFLYGIHAVKEALQNPKRLIQRLLVTDAGFENIREAYDAAQGEGLKVPQPQIVDGFDLERLLPRDAVHQGVLLDVQPLEEMFLPDVLNAVGDNAKILVLDQVTDPHNVGAIIRTAVAFGASAIIVQKLHAPEITGTLAKSASGAVEHCPVIRETNLSRALEQLKEAGFFCIGLDERGKRSIAELNLSGKVALVLGAEGEGLRRLVSENCDELAKLPTSGPIASLNVSNAAAVALYELIRTGK